ncbi:YwgA family protein [Gracilibacillus sp. S3-1-1]|uniref:YwgA family protein n=1 Tax=Gracilibacillus pellucidus TaxID=3095368 RepID=A0ACC6M270_9BACI|nr:YwgA family protein [Gracilibacillus sp. S3-1-1]MDX8045045.1 YwgA family protein [Gracilibacillus sp. S3-1-1]
MLDNHAKLVKVIAASEGIVGRKKLQKIIYIMKKLGLPFEEKYTFYFYGPYSEELSLRIEELTNLGFVSEVKEKKSNYYQYRYEVTDEGTEFLKHSDTELPLEQSLLKEMKSQSSRFLELVATMLYFDHLPKVEVEQKVQEVKKKSNYTLEDMQEAWTFIRKMQK